MLHLLVLKVEEHNMRKVRKIEKIGKIRGVERIKEMKGVEKAIREIK